MGDVAIRVEGLGKQYRLGGPKERYSTLRDQVGKLTSLRGLLRRASRAERRPPFWALKDVSFEVKRGEVVGIIGRNGAGKSTLLKILSRITEPTEGEADIEGRVVSLLEVGSGFHQELTGRENVYLNGAILGMKREEIARKFDDIVGFAEVEMFVDTPVKHYSSGMYTRLAFAVAAHLEPEVLIIDEVLAVGDARFQEKCLGKMGEVARGGRTVLFVSHQMNAIRALCPMALWLTGGRVVEYGNSAGVVGRYLASGNMETDWTADDNSSLGLQNRYFSPRRFTLVDSDLRALCGRTVQANERVGVLIEGHVQDPNSALTVGFAVTAVTGELLFWSQATDQDPALWPEIRLGANRLVGWLPSHFLNEGDYQVELIVSLHFQEWLSEPGRNAPRLTLSVRGGLSQSPFWMAARPGMNAPILRFEAVEMAAGVIAGL